MKEKYLPIGTVVTLNGGTKKVMIIGYCPMTEDKKVFDYSACTYPEGVIESNKTLVFNHSQIMNIDFMGCESDEQKAFSDKIKSMIGNLAELKDVQLTAENPKPEENTPAQTTVSAQTTENKNEIPVLDIAPMQANSITDIMNN